MLEAAGHGSCGTSFVLYENPGNQQIGAMTGGGPQPWGPLALQCLKYVSLLQQGGAWERVVVSLSSSIAAAEITLVPLCHFVTSPCHHVVPLPAKCQVKRLGNVFCFSFPASVSSPVSPHLFGQVFLQILLEPPASFPLHCAPRWLVLLQLACGSWLPSTGCMN